MLSDPQTDRFTSARLDMVETQLRSRGIRDDRVLRAMAKVPRHQFVAEEHRNQAYEDHPIPIGEGQTVSQPYIVALMLAALELKPSDVVLEVGGGSGYQTALLGELAGAVYSIERHESLAQEAKAVLQRLGYTRCTVFVGDGTHGLPQNAPYDAVAVAAAAPQIPPPLFAQLREGGRLVLPVGPPHAQELKLVRKHSGNPLMTSLGYCAFVPLIGGHGFGSE